MKPHPQPDVTFDDLTEPDLLATLLYGEGRGCSDTALAGIAASVRNRVNSGHWFGGPTYHAVILRWAQYDAFWPSMSGADYAPTLAFAKKLLSGQYGGKFSDIANHCMMGPATLADPTFGATHYYDESVAPPAWTKAPAHETLVIDKLHFFAGVL